jgi:hypothetical protein
VDRVVRHRSSTHVRIEETATRTAEVTWNGNIAHTDTKIIASTLVGRRGAREATAATGQGGDS